MGITIEVKRDLGPNFHRACVGVRHEIHTEVTTEISSVGCEILIRFNGIPKCIILATASTTFLDRRGMVLRISDLPSNGLEATPIALERRARRQRNHQVHLRHEAHIVARLALRWIHTQFSALPIDNHIHKTVERNWDRVLLDPPRRERLNKVAETAPVRFRVAVNDTERVF